MAEVVGTAWVRIRALTTGLAGEVSDAVDKMGPKIDSSVSKSGIRTGNTWGKGLSKGAGDSLSKNHDLDAPMATFGDRLSRVFHNAFAKTSAKERTKESSKVDRFLKGFVNKLSSVKVPLPLWAGYFGVPVIVGLAKTATFYLGGLIARTGTLLQGMAGLGAAAGGLLVQTLSVVGLLAAAFKTQTIALAVFQANIKKTAEAWRSVAAATQATLFPGLDAAFVKVTGALVPIFRDLGTYVGGVANNVATTVSNLLTGERGMKMWEGFKTSTQATSNNLGRIVTALIRGFIPLMDALNPIATKLSGALADMVEHWANLLELGSDAGTLQTRLQQWYDIGVKVSSALSDIFKGLWNILQLGSDASGLGALDRFDQFAERFRAWTESMAGENKIKKFFQEAEPVIQEVNGLIADIFRLFFQGVDTGTGSDNIVGILKQLREEILPKVAESIQKLSDSFMGSGGENGSKFVSTLADLMDVFVRAETLVPTMEIVIKLLDAFVIVLNTPVVGSVIADLLALGAALRILRITGATSVLAGVSKGLGGIFKLFAGTTVTTGLKAFASGLLGATEPIVGNAFAAGMQSAGSAVLGFFATIATAVTEFVGGLTLSAVAIPALIAAAAAAVFVGLYFLFSPFRKLIDELWDDIQKIISAFTDGRWMDGIKAIGALLLDLFLLFPRLMISLYKAIFTGIFKLITNLPGWVATAAKFLWQWIQDAVPMVAEKIGGVIDVVEEFLTGLPGKIIGWVSGAADAVWGWLQDAIPLAAEKVGGFFSAIGGALADIAPKVATAVAGAAEAVLSWLVTAVNEFPGKLGYALGFIIGSIIMVPIRIAKVMIPAVQAFVGWVTEAVPAFLSNMAGWISTVVNAVAGFIASLPGMFAGAVTGMVAWVLEAIPTFTSNMSNWINNVVTAIVGFVASIPGTIAGAITAITNWIMDAIPVAMGFLGNLLGSIWGWVSGFISALPGQIVGAATAILSWIGEAERTFASTIASFANTIYHWAIGLPGQIVGWVGQTIGYIGQIGENIIKGIWEGISGMGGWLFDKIKSFAGGIIGGFLDAIGASSPAKKLFPVGEYMVQGIAVGIDNEAQTVHDAFNSMMAPYTNGTWAAGLSMAPLGLDSSFNTSSLVNASLVSSVPNVALTVKIGERDITDIVDTQVDTRNQDLARQLTARNS